MVFVVEGAKQHTERPLL